MKTTLAVGICIITVLIGNPIAEVTWLPHNAAPRNNLWEAESLFIGASMKVVDGTKDVVVIRKKGYSKALGELYFITPEGSLKLMFHNLKKLYPAEADTFVLGKFPISTPIIFMYMVTDTGAFFAHARNKKLYTGQNREGTDIFISENEGMYGKRWAVVGTVGPTIIETGFSAIIPGVFKDIRFHVSNVVIDK